MTDCPLVWNCPECGMACSAPAAAAGKTAPCPRCRKRITAPTPAAAIEEGIIFEGRADILRVWPFLLAGLVSMPIYGFGLLLWLQAAANWLSVWQRVTMEEAVLQKGILSRSVSRVQLRDVRAVTLNQGPVARLFGFADVGLSTAGGGGVEVTLYGVSPALYERINRIISTR